MTTLATIPRMPQADFESINCGVFPVSISVSRFRGRSGVDEYHLMARPTEDASTDTQLKWLSHAYHSALDALGLDARTALLRRFFCSDLLEQAPLLEARPFSNPRNTDEPCAVSWVGQPPMLPARVSLWAYHMQDPLAKLDKTQEDTSLTLRRGGLAHHWTTGVTAMPSDTPYEQTQGIFEKYNAFLRPRGMGLSDNVLRTWFFVDNIDANYGGLVSARREIFAEHGLTQNTHFIASTGIEGAPATVGATVAMDAYAVSGLQPGQVEHIEARDHLGPTADYGVTFERATSVSYRDRKHVFISGTASIDPEGNILFPGNVYRQLDRTIENVEALLDQAGADCSDMRVAIAYVRNPSDQAAVWEEMRGRFGDAPFEVVVAPVCRPGWLVEVEGLAIAPTSKPKLPVF